MDNPPPPPPPLSMELTQIRWFDEVEWKDAVKASDAPVNIIPVPLSPAETILWLVFQMMVNIVYPMKLECWTKTLPEAPNLYPAY